MRKKNIDRSRRHLNRRAFQAVLSAAAAVAGIGIAGQHPLLASTLTWDPGQTPATGSDGSGTWNTSGNSWASGGSDTNWSNGTNIAQFGVGGTAGTVTLGAPITAGGLNFGLTASVSTPATWTAGTSSISVSSASGLAVGQIITGTGIPAGTIITSISGTTIGLSALVTGSGATISTLSQYTVAGSASNTLTLSGTGSINVASGQSATISAPVAGSVGLTASGAGNLVLNGANGTSSYTGATTVQGGGTLTLDFTAPGAPGTNIVNSAGTLALSSGSLFVNSLSSSTAQTFASTSLVAGGSNGISIVGGGSLALGAITAVSSGTLGNGSSVVFNGPATTNLPSSSSTAASNVAATGTISTSTTSTLTGGILASSNGNNDYATVGLYDWAAISGGTVVGGSTVASFYTLSAGSTAPAGNTNFDCVGSAGFSTPGTAYFGTGGSGFARGSSSGTNTVDSVRFNDPSNAQTVVKSGAFFETGGVLITPNMGSVNAELDDLELSATTPTVQIVQNNTGAVFVLGTNAIAADGTFYDAQANASQNDRVVKSGAGTWYIDPDNNIVQNYVKNGGTLTTVNSTNYNFLPRVSTSAAAFFLNGGVTIIDNANVLGNPSSAPTATFGAEGSVNINGGWLMADFGNQSTTTNNGTDNTAQTSSVNLVTTASGSPNHPVFIGTSGGGFAAATGVTLTVGGVIANETSAGSGTLDIGIPASTANGGVAGLVPGTGGTTVNTALMAGGTVVLTGSNTFTGGAAVYSSTLNINGSNAIGGSNGLSLNAGTLQYAVASSNGSNDVSTGTGLTIGSGSSTIDTNGNTVTYSGGLHDGGGSLTIVSSSGSGILTLGGTSSLAGGMTVNSGSLFITGPSATTIALNAGTLGGTGTLGAVTQTASATIASGTAGTGYLGKLTMSNLNSAGGSFTIGIGSLSAGSISTANATFTGTPTFSFVVNGTLNSGSNFVIFKSANTIADNGNLNSLTPYTSGRLTLTPTYNAGADDITVAVSGSFANLVWNPTATNTWDVQTTKSWNNAGTQDFFYPSDFVTFNDSNNTGGSSSPYTVNLNTSVSPSTMTVNSTGNYTITGSGAITGSTGLTKQGSGKLTLSTVNTYTGGTSVTAGTLALGAAGALPSAGTLTVSATGVVDLNGNAQTVAGLTDGGSSTGVVTDSAGIATFTIANAFVDSFSGSIQGNVNLAVAGSATLTLTGANSYSGGTNVTSGSLATGVANTLPSAGTLTVSGTGVVKLSGNSQTIGGLNDGGATTGVVTDSGGATLTINTAAAASFSYGGSLQGTLNLAITGSGTQTLAGANTFTGGTVANGSSTLMLANTNALQNSTVTISSGTLSFGALTTATFGQLTGSGALSLNNASAGTVTLSVGNNGTSTTFGGALTGGGAITKVGGGSLTLTGANTYSGTTNDSVGTIEVTTGGSITGGTLQGSGWLVDGGAITSTGNSTLAASGTAFNESSGTVSISGTFAASTSADGTLFKITGGSFTAATINLGRTNDNGAGTVAAPTAAPTTTGLYVDGATANVSAGSIEIGTSNSSASVRLDAGSLNVSNEIIDGTQTATAGRWNILQVNGGTLTAANAGNGIIIAQNGGTNANDADFYISGGTVFTPKIAFGSAADQVGGNGSLCIGSATAGTGILYVGAGGITLANPAGLAATVALSNGTLAAYAPWSSSLPMTLGSGTTAFTIQTADASGVGQNISLSGTLSGGSLNKTGSGSLILSTAESYSGATTINAGTLALGDGINDGSIDSTTAVTDNGTLLYNLQNGGDTPPYVISGTGNVTVSGIQQVVFAQNETYSGTTLVSGGTLDVTGAIASSGTINVGGAGNLTVDAGSALLSTAALTNNGTTNFSSISGTNTVGTIDGTGTLTASGTSLTATHIRQASLTIAGSSSVIIAANGTSAATSVITSLADSGTLNLKNNDLIVGTDPGVGTLIASAYNHGAWNQPGITSSSALAHTGYNLGYATIGSGAGQLNISTFDGQPVSSGNVAVKYTLNGDLNLDNTVDQNDIALLAPHYGISSGATWYQGDVNHDGAVDQNDIALIAPNYGQSANAPGNALTPGIKTALTRSASPSFSSSGLSGGAVSPAITHLYTWDAALPDATAGNVIIKVDNTTGDSHFGDVILQGNSATLYTLVITSTSGSMNSGRYDSLNAQYNGGGGSEAATLQGLAVDNTTNHSGNFSVFSQTANKINEAGLGVTLDFTSNAESVDLSTKANNKNLFSGITPDLAFSWSGQNGTLVSGAVEYTVTPEPGMLGMLGVGGVMMMRRRRKAR